MLVVVFTGKKIYPLLTCIGDSPMGMGGPVGPLFLIWKRRGDMCKGRMADEEA